MSRRGDGVSASGGAQRPLPFRKLRNDQALCDAASVGDLGRLRRLLSEGVSPDSADEEGTTALMAASFAGQSEIVAALLEAGADPDAQDVSGVTALMNAVIANCEMDLGDSHPIFLEIVHLLCDAGADVELEDEDGMTALEHALCCELEDLALALGG